MKPVSSGILVVIIFALCGLCAWQWHRESQLRQRHLSVLREVEELTTARDDLSARVKTADSEILRLTQALADLRANSVSKQLHEELTEQALRLKESIDKQNTVITQQNASLAQAATSIDQANASITKLASQRDELVKKLNDTIAEMNARQKNTEK